MLESGSDFHVREETEKERTRIAWKFFLDVCDVTSAQTQQNPGTLGED